MKKEEEGKDKGKNKEEMMTSVNMLQPRAVEPSFTSPYVELDHFSALRPLVSSFGGALRIASK